MTAGLDSCRKSSLLCHMKHLKFVYVVKEDMDTCNCKILLVILMLFLSCVRTSVLSGLGLLHVKVSLRCCLIDNGESGDRLEDNRK